MKPKQPPRWLIWRNWSFTTRLTVVIVLLVAITLTGVTYITTRTVQTTLSNQIGANFEAQAKSLSQQITGFFLEKVSQVQAIAAIDLIKEELEARNNSYSGTRDEIVVQIQTLDTAWVDAADDDPLIRSIITPDPEINPVAFQLAGFHETFDDHVEIFVTDRYGATVGATNRLSDYYQADEGWWQAAWNNGQGAVYISEPEFDESAGIVAFLVAVPVFDEETGDIIGIVRSTLLADELFNLVGRVSFGQTGRSILFNQNGQVLFDPLAGTEEDATNLPAALKQRFIGLESGFDVAGDADGNASIFGHAVVSGRTESSEVGSSKNPVAVAVANLGWASVIQQETEEAFASVDQIAQSNLVAGLVAVVLFTLVAFFVAQTVTKPLVVLGAAAAQIGAGKLDAPLPPAGDDEIGRLAAGFAAMAGQLRQLIGSLEQRIAARTQRLETVAALSERLTAILDVDQLLVELVNQVKERFGYYHAHIYIVDNLRQNLVMTAGVGEAGAKMKARGHSIPLNAPASLVARAARSGQIVRVDNVREAPDWLPNPLLPDTYSEMAVPIIVEGEIMGVLDVQQDRIAGLDEGDAGLLRSLANQVAVALRNARLFAEVETALADARAAQESYITRAWQETGAASQERQHFYARPDAPPLRDDEIAVAQQLALTQPGPAAVTLNGDAAGSKTIAAPVTVGGKPIGTFQLHRRAEGGDASPWTDDDLSLVETVLEQVAQTAENLRLFEETRERAGREQTIREITDKLRAATDLNTLLETAARELGQRLNMPHTVLELGTDSSSPVADHRRQQQAEQP